MIGNVQRNARQYHYHIDHTYTNAEDTQQPASLVMPTDGPLEMVPCVVRAHMRTIASFFPPSPPTLLSKNQSSSHLWHHAQFHEPCALYTCVQSIPRSSVQCEWEKRGAVECIRKKGGGDLTSRTPTHNRKRALTHLVLKGVSHNGFQQSQLRL